MSEQEAIALKTLKASGYNQREIDYITKKRSRDLTELYLGRYIEKIRDEYQPLGVGLDRLDECSVTDLLSQEGASGRDSEHRFGRFSAPQAFGLKRLFGAGFALGPTRALSSEGRQPSSS